MFGKTLIIITYLLVVITKELTVLIPMKSILKTKMLRLFILNTLKEQAVLN